MSTFRGLDGSIKFGAGTVANITAWSMNVDAELLEDTVMGAVGWRSNKGGLAQWNAQVTARLDYGDTAGQKAMLDTLFASSPPLTATAMEFIVSGTTKKFTGTGVIIGVQITQQLGNIVEVQFTIRGSGAPAITWS